MGNIFGYAFEPYITLFGNITWGIIFGFMGAALYVAAERSVLHIFGYLIIVGVFFAIILPTALIAILGLIASFIGATIVYRTFVESRSY